MSGLPTVCHDIDRNSKTVLYSMYHANKVIFSLIISIIQKNIPNLCRGNAAGFKKNVLGSRLESKVFVNCRNKLIKYLDVFRPDRYFVRGVWVQS